MKLDWIIPLIISGFVVSGYFISTSLDIFGSENLATMILELVVAAVLAFIVSRYFFKRGTDEREDSDKRKISQKEWIFHEIERSLTLAGTDLPNREELESSDFSNTPGLSPVERVTFAVNSIQNVKAIINSNVEVFDISIMQEIHRISNNIEKGFTISDKYQAAVETLDEIDVGITNIIKMIKENGKKNSNASN